MAADRHFFASSFVHWQVAKTLDEVVLTMDKLDHCGDPYSIWLIPLPMDAEYEFDQRHGPWVQGRVLLGSVSDGQLQNWTESVMKLIEKPSTEDARDASSPDVLEGVN